MAKATTPATTRRGTANPRPRGGKQFDFSKHSRPKSRTPKDDKTIRTDATQIELVRPAWNGSTGTTFRPLPCFDIAVENEDVFMHSRKEPKEWFYSDWIRGYSAAKYVGIDLKLTFLLCDPRDDYDMSLNPYVALYRAIMDATKHGEAMIGTKNVITTKWFPLTNRESPKCAFSNPTTLYYVQGLVYQHNGEVLVGGGRPRGAKPKDLPQIIQLSRSAGEELLELLNQFRRDGRGDGCSAFQVPDVTSLEEGFYITIFNPDKHPLPGNSAVTLAAGEGVKEEEYTEESEGGGKSRSREFKGWKTHVGDQFIYTKDGATYKAKRDLTPLEAKIRENLLWFDNILRVPSAEETAAWCAAAYRSMPDLLHFGWQDNPEFFTDEVRGILAAKTSGAGVEVPSIEEDEAYDEGDELPGASAALPVLSGDDEEDDDGKKMLAAAKEAQERARRRREGLPEEGGESDSRVSGDDGATRRKKRKKVTSPASRKKVPGKKSAAKNR